MFISDNIGGTGDSLCQSWTVQCTTVSIRVVEPHFFFCGSVPVPFRATFWNAVPFQFRSGSGSGSGSGSFKMTIFLSLKLSLTNRRILQNLSLSLQTLTVTK